MEKNVHSHHADLPYILLRIMDAKDLLKMLAMWQRILV